MEKILSQEKVAEVSPQKKLKPEASKEKKKASQPQHN
jgi:hypothetical protein